jgi:hypothetical protein
MTTTCKIGNHKRLKRWQEFPTCDQDQLCAGAEKANHRKPQKKRPQLDTFQKAVEQKDTCTITGPALDTNNLILSISEDLP